MGTPKYEQPQLDGGFYAAKAQADTDRTKAIQGNLADFQAKMLMRYGAGTVLSGASTPSPLSLGPLMSSGSGGAMLGAA